MNNLIRKHQNSIRYIKNFRASIAYIALMQFISNILIIYSIGIVIIIMDKRYQLENLIFSNNSTHTHTHTQNFQLPMLYYLKKTQKYLEYGFLKIMKMINNIIKMLKS